MLLNNMLELRSTSIGQEWEAFEHSNKVEKLKGLFSFPSEALCRKQNLFQRQ
jgi:hypothetical protein